MEQSTPQFEGDFTSSDQFFFEDSRLGTDPYLEVGSILVDEGEAASIANVVAALRNAIAEVGVDADDGTILGSGRWQVVVSSAREALQQLRRPHEPQGNAC